VGFEFLIYDVTSTFFEGQALGNPKAARGYSRDQRPDCKQVCIGLVVSPEGLPLAYELFAGNRTDVTTVEEIITLMEEKYGQAKRIWVLDRGMVSEENIEFLRVRQAQYIVGTPKAQLRQFEAALLEAKNWKQVREGVEVKLLPHPDGKGQEQFVLCRSLARREKEKALWRTLELWMKGKGLGTCARQLVGEIATLKSLDVILPVKTGEQVSELRLRTVARPERMVLELLQRLGLELPEQSRMIEAAAANVVQKTGLQNT